MSIICCRVKEKEIEIAADSITVRGYTQEKGKDNYSKLFKVNEMIIGGVGISAETSMLQIYASTRKPSTPTEDGILNFISEFAEWKKRKTEKYGIENAYIIVFEGRVFMNQGFFVKEITSYEAIGAGENYALSALYLGHDVEKAVDVACELSIFCEKPIKVMKATRHTIEERQN